jgi:serine/threonine protein kinase/tetratricopeptide (TPR) repeat protein
MPKRILFGRYELQSTLSDAGMSSVYLSKDLQLDKEVVVKIFTMNPKEMDSCNERRFRSEIALLQTLDHPGVVKVFDCGLDGDDIYFIMEYIPGLSLSKCENISIRKQFDIFIDIAEVIGFLHSKGIVHRDIKPSNIIVLPEVDSHGKRAKLLDFGLARFSEDGRITAKGMVVGTMNYLAPEQLLRGEVDSRSDLYSFGVTMFKVLTGKYPYALNNPEDMAYQILEGSIPEASSEKSSVPRTLSTLVSSLLRKDPSQRPQSIEEVIEILKEIKASFALSEPLDEVNLQVPLLTGRDWELRNIMQAWNDKNETNIFLVSGTFGIGKSRLLDEFSSRLLIFQQSVLRARGNTSSVPNQGTGLMQLSFGILHINEELIQTNCSEVDAKYIAVRDELIQSSRKSKSHIDVRELCSNFEIFLTSIPSRIAIVLDDIHMLDELSLDVIISSAKKNRNIFLLMSRDIKQKNVHKHLLEDTKMNDSILKPLEALTFVKFIQESLGSANLPSDLYADVIGNSKGNPLFALEFLRSQIKKKRISKKFGRIEYSGEKTDSELFFDRDIVGISLMGLSLLAKTILEFSAIYNDSFSTNDIISCLSFTRIQAVRGITELEESLLLSSTKRGCNVFYRFNNNFLKSSVVSRIDEKQKKFLYRKIAKFFLRKKVLDIDDYLNISIYYFKSDQLSKALSSFILYLWHDIMARKKNREEILSKINEISEIVEYSVWQFVLDIVDASIIYRNGNKEESKKMVQRHLIGNNAQRFIVEYLLAKIDFHSGDALSAIQTLNSIIDNTKNIDKFREIKIQTNIFLAEIYQSQFELLKAKSFIDTAIELSNNSDTFMLIEALKVSASISITMLDIKDAEEIVKKSQIFVTKRKSDETSLWFDRVLAITEYLKGNLYGSKEMFLKCVSSGRSKHGLELLTTIHLMRIDYYLGNWESAIKKANKNSSISGGHSKTFSIVVAGYFKIMIELSRGLIEIANTHALKFFNYSKNINYLPAKIMSNLALGSVILFSGQTKKVAGLFRDAWDCAVQTKQPGLMIDVIFHIINSPNIIIQDDLLKNMNFHIDQIDSSNFPQQYVLIYKFCTSVLACISPRNSIAVLSNSILILQDVMNCAGKENVIFAAHSMMQSARLHFLRAQITKRKADIEAIERMLFGAEFIWQVLEASEELKNIERLRADYRISP